MALRVESTNQPKALELLGDSEDSPATARSEAYGLLNDVIRITASSTSTASRGS